MINYCQMLENNPKLSISVLPSLERLVITDLRYSTTLLINITSKGLGIVTLEKDQSNHLTSRMSSTTSGRISQTTLFLVGNMVFVLFCCFVFGTHVAEQQIITKWWSLQPQLAVLRWVHVSCSFKELSKKQLRCWFPRNDLNQFLKELVISSNR